MLDKKIGKKYKVGQDQNTLMFALRKFIKNYCQSFISDGRLDTSICLNNFEIYLIYPNFLRSESWVTRQHGYKVCYARYQVPFLKHYQQPVSPQSNFYGKKDAQVTENESGKFCR